MPNAHRRPMQSSRYENTLRAQPEGPASASHVKQLHAKPHAPPWDEAYLRGEAVYIHFFLRNSGLYAFQFVDTAAAVREDAEESGNFFFQAANSNWTSTTTLLKPKKIPISRIFNPSAPGCVKQRNPLA